MTDDTKKTVKSPYEILGLSQRATSSEIKSAYRTLARGGAHPDVGGTAVAFIMIKRAYELLIDPKRRKVYDSLHTMVEEDAKQPPVDDGVWNIPSSSGSAWNMQFNSGSMFFAGSINTQKVHPTVIMIPRRAIQQMRIASVSMPMSGATSVDQIDLIVDMARVTGRPVAGDEVLIEFFSYTGSTLTLRCDVITARYAIRANDLIGELELSTGGIPWTP